MEERTLETSKKRLAVAQREREFFIDNLMVRIHFVIVMMRWTGLAPWGFESPFPGSLTSTFLQRHAVACNVGVQGLQGYLSHKKQPPPRATIGP